MRWASAALMLAGLLALAAFWCLTQHGAAHLSLGSSGGGTDLVLDLHATGARALVALGAAILSLLLFIFGFIRALGHFGRPASGQTAPPSTAPPAAAETGMTPEEHD